MRVRNKKQNENEGKIATKKKTYKHTAETNKK